MNLIIFFLLFILLFILFYFVVDQEPISCMSLNSKDICNLTLSKKRTNQFLKNIGYPIPNGFYINHNTNIDKQILLSKVKFPLIIKPVDGSCGVDVKTGITNSLQLKMIANHLLKRNNELLVEEELKGTVYRILYVNKKLVSIIGRDVPYVIGDGKNTIEQLNKMRNHNLENSQYMVKLNNDYIRSQGYKLDSIPNKDDKVYINNVLNYSGGAITYNYDLNKMHPKNKKLFDDLLNKYLDSNCIGIDFISNDLSVPYDKNGGTIIEFNSNPSRKLHYVFDSGFSDRYYKIYDDND